MATPLLLVSIASSIFRSPNANLTTDAHEKGVNYVDFYPGADKPYLVTTGDDKTVKIWDYLSKSCVQTMEGHTNNVSFAVFHPNLLIVISGSEDGTVKVWNSIHFLMRRRSLECLNHSSSPNWTHEPWRERGVHN